MPDSPEDPLTDKALHALIEFCRLYREPITDRERALLRFTLAFLYRGGDRAPYDSFYREACVEADGTDTRSVGRFQNMRAALAGILGQHGREYW